jgi:hypothetical protein
MILTAQLPTDGHALGRLTRAWSTWWLSPRPIAAALPRGIDRDARVVTDWREPLNDVPSGRYELREIVVVPDAAELLSEFGRAYLLFEPLDGDAVAAEAHGRLALAVHAGIEGRDGHMRGTTGHLRVSDATLEELLELVDVATGPIYLDVERQDRDGPAPLSETPAAHLALPEGERRPFVPQSSHSDSTTTRDEDDSWRRDDGGRSSGEPWRPGGGRFAGAGNAGSWDDLVAARPLAVAAAGASAATVVANSVEASDRDESSTVHADSTTGSPTAY